MSRVAYVVLAHHKPAQVAVLLNALGPASVYLHISKRTPSELAQKLSGPWPANVRLLDRLPTRWASWQVVRAALAGFRAGLADGATHLVLLSGQDLPLVPHETISEFCESAGQQTFMPMISLPSPIYGPKQGVDRFRWRHFSVANRDVTLPLANPWPDGLKPTLSSFFALIDARTAQFLLSAADDHDTARFFQRVWIPEEAFMSTVLATSGREVVNENLWYIDWRGEDSRHPRTLGSSDVPALTRVAGREGDESGYGRAKLFARKFDIDTSGSQMFQDLQDSLRVPYLV